MSGPSSVSFRWAVSMRLVFCWQWGLGSRAVYLNIWLDKGLPAHLLNHPPSLQHLQKLTAACATPAIYLFPELHFPVPLSYLIRKKQENSPVISLNRTWWNSSQKIRRKGLLCASEARNQQRKVRMASVIWVGNMISIPSQGDALSVPGFSSLGFSSVKQQFQATALGWNTMN